MTDGERLSVISYVRERFDSQDEQLDNIIERLESLESDRDHRDGRNNFVKNAGKTIAGVIAAVLAALGIKSQVGL
jgi:hypothetical protein